LYFPTVAVTFSSKATSLWKWTVHFRQSSTRLVAVRQTTVVPVPPRHRLILTVLFYRENVMRAAERKAEERRSNRATRSSCASWRRSIKDCATAAELVMFSANLPARCVTHALPL